MADASDAMRPLALSMVWRRCAYEGSGRRARAFGFGNDGGGGGAGAGVGNLEDVGCGFLLWLFALKSGTFSRNLGRAGLEALGVRRTTPLSWIVGSEDGFSFGC